MIKFRDRVVNYVLRGHEKFELCDRKSLRKRNN